MSDYKNNLYFIQLTVYQYDKKKIKMDYSCIPVSVLEEKFNLPSKIKSLVSGEEIDINKLKYFINNEIKYNDKIMYLGKMSGRKKEGKAKKISLLVAAPDMEDDNEKTMRKWAVSDFKTHFWWKRKYIKFLNKKINLKQI